MGGQHRLTMCSSTLRCRRRTSPPRDSRPGTELRQTLPIRRVVGPADVAVLAVHLMADTALTGATYDRRWPAVRLVIDLGGADHGIPRRIWRGGSGWDAG